MINLDNTRVGLISLNFTKITSKSWFFAYFTEAYKIAKLGFESLPLRTDEKSLLFLILEIVKYGSLKLRLAIFLFLNWAFQSRVFVIISCFLFFLISNSFLALIGYKKTFFIRSKVISLLFCFCCFKSCKSFSNCIISLLSVFLFDRKLL